jgi:hypothetical protein
MQQRDDMTVQNRVEKLLRECASAETHLPPSTLYNEGWMLRLILDWCAENPERRHRSPFFNDHAGIPRRCFQVASVVGEALESVSRTQTA